MLRMNDGRYWSIVDIDHEWGTEEVDGCALFRCVV